VCLPEKIFEEEDHMMKAEGLEFRSEDIQFMKLESTISHGLSLPREIGMVAPIQVVKI
jgi:hypothetical protein